jgi:CheY-like chemotaxis protein
MSKILLIEDETDIREALCDALQDRGYAISCAVDGEEGLQKAVAEQPDVIVLDMKMPVMDGPAMLEKLRKDPWGKGAKVIILTAFDDSPTITVALESDPSYYLVKTNVSLEEIGDKIAEVLQP